MTKDKDMEQIVKDHKEREAKYRQENLDLMAEYNPEALLADGFENALIGFSHDGKAVYDIHECIQTLVHRDGMDFEEAQEYFEFNTLCAYVGEFTPIFIYKFNTRENFCDLIERN